MTIRCHLITLIFPRLLFRLFYKIKPIFFCACAGYYCLANTTHAHHYPCPRGTFNNVTGSIDDSFCQPCLGGMYCDQEGLATPAGLCNPGYYCTSGSNSSTPNLGDQVCEWIDYLVFLFALILQFSLKIASHICDILISLF